MSDNPTINDIVEVATVIVNDPDTTEDVSLADIATTVFDEFSGTSTGEDTSSDDS
jgi:hypothetical protein